MTCNIVYDKIQKDTLAIDIIIFISSLLNRYELLMSIVYINIIYIVYLLYK